MLIQLLFESPILFVMLAIALMLSIAIHEFSHAYASHTLGDDTAKSLGRITLNPLVHLDPIGTALLLFAGFGWGKPVPFNPYNLKDPKRDSALIALAGPSSNFALAAIFALLFYFLGELPLLGTFLYLVVFYNLVLGIFNLIPIHPLDGFKVVNGVLPPALSVQWMQLAPYGIYILLVLVLTRAVGMIISPAINFTLGILGMPPL